METRSKACNGLHIVATIANILGTIFQNFQAVIISTANIS